MKRFWISVFTIFLLQFAQAPDTHAWYPGKFKEMRLEREREKQAQSQVNAPARPGSRYTEGNAKIAGLDVAVWSPTSARMPVPLIIFSHGYLGCNTQTRFLMRAIAAEGYLVLAPNHNDASCGGGKGRLQADFVKPENWNENTHKDRADDIASLLSAMRRHPQYASRIDWSKVALAGHSLGGYTVLGMAGAWPSWQLSGIRAVLALSPWCQPYVLQDSLKMGVPVQYQGGNLDWGITPSISLPGGAYDKTSSPAYFVEFEGANHFSWTDLDPDHQALISYYAVAFLNQYVKDIPSDLVSKRKGVAQLRAK